ncbi:hypothetical protein FOA52_001422 [Chlamydomonas sp. UWO 241]|nr:hypothetical protein FOA52_001422 [Chlamydomonas sp. UWO 241]
MASLGATSSAFGVSTRLRGGSLAALLPRRRLTVSDARPCGSAWGRRQAVVAASASAPPPEEQGPLPPGSTRRVRRSEVSSAGEQQQQQQQQQQAGGSSSPYPYGPSRTPLPDGIPPSRLRDAAVTMAAIEGATEWGQLPGLYTAVVKLPANHMHLLTMAQQLVLLAPEEPKDQQELQDLMRFAEEIVRATRPSLDGQYSLAQTAQLLTCFINLGVAPNENWLYAVEQAGLQQLVAEDGVSLLDATAVVAASWCFQAVGHTPTEGWVRALPLCAQAAWGASGVGSVSGGGLAPDSVFTAEGEEVDVSSGGVRGVNGSVSGGVEPLPAQLLVTLSRASALWRMAPPGAPESHDAESWLAQMLTALYYALDATAERYGSNTSGGESDGTEFAPGEENRLHLEAGELGDVVWGVLMSGVRPPAQWRSRCIAASAALLAHHATRRSGPSIGPDTCLSLLGGLSAMGATPATAAVAAASSGGEDAVGEAPVPDAQWLVSLLSCAARAPDASPSGDILARLLFEAGGCGLELGGGAGDAALVLAQRAQLVMMADEQAARGTSSTTEAAGATSGTVQEGGRTDGESGGVLSMSAKGLALLLMGCARFQLLPSRLDAGWLKAWCSRARALCRAFTPDEVAGLLAAASAARIAMPPEVLYDVVGAFMGVGTVASQRQQMAGTAGAPPPGRSSPVTIEQLVGVLEALVDQAVPLPAAWLAPLRTLADGAMPAAAPASRAQAQAGGDGGSGEQLVARLCLALLQVSGMMAAEAPTQWLASVLSRLAATPGGVGGPGGERLVEVAQALGEHGRIATALMPVVEAGSLAELARLTTSQAAQLMRAFAVTGHAPRDDWWAALAAADRSNGSSNSSSNSSSSSNGSGQGGEGSDASSSGAAQQAAELSTSTSVALASFAALRSVVGADRIGGSAGASWYSSVRARAHAQLAALADYRSQQTMGDGGGGGGGGSTGEELPPALLLLPGVAATQDAVPAASCDALVAATLALRGLGGTATRTCCLEIFRVSGFTPSDAWLDAAVECAAAQLDQGQGKPGGAALAPQDVASLLSALASTATSGSDSSNASSSSASSSSSGARAQVARRLVSEARRSAKRFSAPQAASVLRAAHALGLGDELRGTGDATTSGTSSTSTASGTASGTTGGTASGGDAGDAGLRTLLGVVASSPGALPSGALCGLLRDVAELGVRPGDAWVSAVAGALLAPPRSAPAPRGGGAAAAGGGGGDGRGGAAVGVGPSLGARALDDLVVAADAWGAQLPRALLDAVTAGVARAADGDPAAATRALHLLANQVAWAPAAGQVSAAEALLLPALSDGRLPSECHAPLLYALARAARATVAAPAPAAAGSPAGGGGGYTPDADRLSAAVEASGGCLARYSPEHACTVFTSLVALRAPLPPSWLDALYAYVPPASVPPRLLPGLAMAAARAGEAGGRQPPGAWLKGLQGAAAAAADQLGSRDAAMLLSSLSRAGCRPDAAFVEALLALALARARDEGAAAAAAAAVAAAAARAKEGAGATGPQRAGAPQPAAQKQAQAGPEAAGMAGLLVAAHATLGYVPPPQWCDEAAPHLLRVLPRIADPRGRAAIQAALDATASARPSSVA